MGVPRAASVTPTGENDSGASRQQGDLGWIVFAAVTRHRATRDDADCGAEHDIAQEVTILMKTRRRHVGGKDVRGNRATPSEVPLEGGGEGERVGGVTRWKRGATTVIRSFPT